jgi:hypothetical protein
MVEDEWNGDEEDGELPVLGEDLPRHRSIRPLALPMHRGNVKENDAAEARTAILAKATGRAHEELDEWRQQLALGQRDRAAATLSARRSGSGNGFGLA